jgi:peptide chain release factor 1
VAIQDTGRNHADPALDQRSPSDFVLEWYSGSGSGGQHRNKHQNSARITHKPTGIVRTAQTRDRENSRRLAMEAIIGELDARKFGQNMEGADKHRRTQTGSGQRGDKIRTYRERDNIVVDHRSGKRSTWRDVMENGRFDLVA